ncbi:uncharacterized protein LOC126770654 [Nymphalis io]|uniref:uncharacterized protein LOC126770654 n=1 Tax=Inachis io TaxID=171585 RepID=UPI002168E6D8|nr:uncharacterized protein LOC126770654 [Nymphalis io]
MAIFSIQHTYFFILLTLLVGHGDGHWKKSSKDVFQRDMKLYKEMTEKMKEELEEFYGEYSNEPINDYFIEEIDYVQSKIEKHLRSKMKKERTKEISFSHVNFSEKDHHVKIPQTKEYVTNISSENHDINSIHESGATTNVMWPKFDDILLAIGKQYDWKNDRWIKVKAKMRDKQKNTLNKLNNMAEHQKHNFKYKIVKLNRAKSKRKIVIAVTAVR